jgi:hypothetical protein
LQKPEGAPFDDRANGAVERDDGRYDFVVFARLCFREPDTGVFRIRIAAGRANAVAKRLRRALNGVGGGYESIFNRAGHEHQSAP